MTPYLELREFPLNLGFPKFKITIVVTVKFKFTF